MNLSNERRRALRRRAFRRSGATVRGSGATWRQHCRADAPDGQEAAREAGVDMHMSKPFSREELQAMCLRFISSDL